MTEYFAVSAEMAVDSRGVYFQAETLQPQSSWYSLAILRSMAVFWARSKQQTRTWRIRACDLQAGRNYEGSMAKDATQKASNQGQQTPCIAASPSQRKTRRNDNMESFLNELRAFKLKVSQYKYDERFQPAVILYTGAS